MSSARLSDVVLVASRRAFLGCGTDGDACVAVGACRWVAGGVDDCGDGGRAIVSGSGVAVSSVTVGDSDA